jgi:hypothetical protein
MENFPDTQNKEPEKKDKNINEINDKSEIVLNNININGVIKEKKLKANHEREKYISLANFYINLNIKPTTDDPNYSNIELKNAAEDPTYTMSGHERKEDTYVNSTVYLMLQNGWTENRIYDSQNNIMCSLLLGG